MGHLSIGAMPQKDYFVQTEIDRLRVNISFVGADKKVIMVTSSEPNEGKSYISVSLWDELVAAGRRCVFVDTDMRKSVIRSELLITTDQPQFIGLSHYLAGYCEISDILYETDRTNAYFIPTTTITNPSILFEGDRFNQLMVTLREYFDYVILDTPPLGIVSDGQMMASKCDGCVLVVRAHKTSRSMVRGSVMQLQNVKCPLLGVVLNRMEYQRTKGYYTKGYYRGYYSKGYYSNSGDNGSKDAASSSGHHKSRHGSRKHSKSGSAGGMDSSGVK